MNMKIGQTTIRVTVEGCIKCGTRGSSGWSVARVVPVKIGDKADTITLHICEDCQPTKKRKKKD